MIERLLDAERAMSFGQLDHAEEIYEQVSISDPKNSIAVVGLARVALERGDDLGAYMLARRALGIDPENDAARRMAVRLEEVLATRGEPVGDPLPTDALATAPEPAPGGPLSAPDGPLPAPATDPPLPEPAAHTPTPSVGPASPPAEPPPPMSGEHIAKSRPPRRKRRSLIDRLRRR